MSGAERGQVIPDTLGPYRLGQPIGAGGMGWVYSATDTRNGQQVAIKVIRPDRARDRRFRATFLQEARVASIFRSQHVVRVLDYGETAGRLYMVMEYVDGETLEATLADGPVEPELAVHVALGVAAALEEAEKHEVVHRDIKPANILIAKDGLTKVADFGIASVSQPGTRGAASSAVVGVLGYMAPEMFTNRADNRSDIYSLGATLFHMLAGAPPFEGDLKTLMSAQEGAPPPLELLGDTPPGLRDVVGKCLAKHPDDRYQTAAELGAALREAASAARLAPPRFQETIGRTPPAGSGRLRGALLTLGAALAAFAALGLLSWWVLIRDGDGDARANGTDRTAVLISSFELQAVNCSPSTALVGQPIECAAVVSVPVEKVSFNWAADGGSPASGSDGKFLLTFTSAGEAKKVTVKACAAGSSPCIERTALVSVNDADAGPPPDAGFACVPSPARQDEPLNCAPLQTVDGELLTWSAAGAEPDAGSERSFKPAFRVQGIRSVSLTACVAAGPKKSCATAEQSIAVQATAPSPTTPPSGPGGSPTVPPQGRPVISDIACTKTALLVGEGVTCTATVSGTVTSRTWLAADGTPPSGTAGAFSTSFGTDGPKSILLQACNESGCASDSQTVAVNREAPPAVSVDCAPRVVLVGGTVSCSASGAVAAWTWNAPGGLPASGTDPTLATSYNSGGTKTITVTGCNGPSCGVGSATVSVVSPTATPTATATATATATPTPTPTPASPCGGGHAPTPPAVFASTGSTAGTINLTWPPTGGCTTGYTVYYSTTSNVAAVGTGVRATDGMIQLGNITNYVLGSALALNPSTVYYVWLYSYGPGDTQSTGFASSSAAAGAPTVAPPSPCGGGPAPTPASLTAATGSVSGTITLSWQPAGGCTTGYYVYYSTTNNLNAIVSGVRATDGVIQLGNVTNYLLGTAVTLNPSTAYYVWLYSYGPGDTQSAGFASSSAISGASAVPPPSPCAGGHAPTPASLSASTGSAAGTINLSWQPAGGCTTGYYVYYSTTNNVNAVATGVRASDGVVQPGNVTSYVLGSALALNPSTVYYVWLYSYGPGDTQSTGYASSSATSGANTAVRHSDVSVPGTANNMSSGVTFKAGEHVSITASGTVGINQPVGGPEYKAYGPGGDSGCTSVVDRSHFPASTLPCWSLIGRTSPGGAYFFVGASSSFTASADGTLFFTVNDDNTSDNSGSWAVSVNIS